MDPCFCFVDTVDAVQFPLFYASFAAPMGHALAQAPQSVHFSASTVKMSPSLIASTGQSVEHTPHAMQESSMM
jgi:hypothetical protein